jgi:hypothetical protein
VNNNSLGEPDSAVWDCIVPNVYTWRAVGRKS